MLQVIPKVIAKILEYLGLGLEGKDMMKKFCRYIHNSAATRGRFVRLQSNLHFSKQNKAEATGAARQ